MVVDSFCLLQDLVCQHRPLGDVDDALLLMLAEGISLRCLRVDDHNISSTIVRRWDEIEDALLVGLGEGVGLGRLAADGEYTLSGVHNGEVVVFVGMVEGKFEVC